MILKDTSRKRHSFCQIRFHSYEPNFPIGPNHNDKAYLKRNLTKD